LFLEHHSSDGTAAADRLPVATEGYGPLIQSRICSSDYPFIAMIDLSRTCESIIILILNLLVMFVSYFWIKIKLKVLIFSTPTTFFFLLLWIEDKHELNATPS
jgi:hypothetical protein